MEKVTLRELDSGMQLQVKLNKNLFTMKKQSPPGWVIKQLSQTIFWATVKTIAPSVLWTT